MKVPEDKHMMCKSPLHTSLMVYNCELFQHHFGPCATMSNADTVKNRIQWEKANPEKADLVSTPNV